MNSRKAKTNTIARETASNDSPVRDGCVVFAMKKQAATRTLCRLGFFGAIAMAFLPVVLHGVQRESVTHEAYQDFRDGVLEEVSLHRDGRLALAPGATEIASMADTVIWSVSSGPDGSVYIGAGNEGKVYRLGEDGELDEIFATDEILVRAMAVDRQGRLYVGTSPDGKVYRYTGESEPDVFFDPRETYIWSMVFDDEGDLFVATGDEGRIYRVASGAEPGGDGEVYFDSDESHISTLSWDKQGRLLAGSSPNGYLYRLDEAESAFVLFNSPDEEVRHVMPGSEEELYVATFSASGKGSSAGSTTVAQAMAELAPDDAKDDEEEKTGSSQNSSNGGGRPSTIYRVDGDGFYEPFWGMTGVTVHSLLSLDEGPLLIGTGDEGRIFSLSGFQSWKLRQTLPSGSDVSAMLRRRGNRDVLAFTSNPARIFQLDFGMSDDGEFTSEVFDGGQVSRWGRLYVETSNAGRDGLEVFVRSGNTETADSSWTPWKSVDRAGKGEAPPARYFQYRLSFAQEAVEMEVRRVRFFYRHANAAPVISALRAITANIGLEKYELAPQTPSLDLDQLLQNPPSRPNASPEPREQLRAFERPGTVTIAWQARDANDDDLVFTVDLREADADAWHTIGSKVRENFHSFNGNGYTDGQYQARVVASDRLSNPPGEEREARRVSAMFQIDNTAPKIEVGEVEVEGAVASIRFRVVDELSILAEVDYALNGEEPMALFPEDGLFDGKEEEFSLKLDKLSAGRHTLIIRATEEGQNTRVNQLTFEVEAQE